MWDVDATDEFAEWFGGLDRQEKVRVEATIERVEEEGPALGRPWADSLRGTKVKELIPRGGQLRILFRFDPRRTAILLLGGDKNKQWHTWYRENIPVAERLYEAYLNQLRKENLIR